MRDIAIALIYVAFFGLIAAACYWTESAMPLWALLLTPSIHLWNRAHPDAD